MHNLDYYYRLLGLEPGASHEEINQAYKDLAFIWHPDRIPKDNQRLQHKAQEKLKEINQARDHLREIKSRYQQHTTKPASPESTPPRHQQQPPRPHYSNRYSQPQSKSQQSDYQAKKPASDLSGADLRGASLKEKDLSGRNLSNANLSNADLSDAFLHKVNLQGANLYRANLFRANLLQSNLCGANLQEVNLIGADLSGADLSGANLKGAKVGTQNRLMVKLTGAKLTGTIMPDGTIHN